MEILAGMDQTVIVIFIAVAVGGGAVALLLPWLTGSTAAKRVARVTEKSTAPRKGFRARFGEDPKDARRKQIQDSLKQFEERVKQRSNRVTLHTLLLQSGLGISFATFWIVSLIVGAACAALSVVSGVPWPAAIVAGLVGAVGLPRWFLGVIKKRRQQVFLNDFADAIDVMVRGLKAGLPVNDALNVIASETPAPVGPEFAEIIEGQRVGITIDQGVERMYERMPLAEVNFLAIVLAIQQKTGGNLAEALNNLSRVLRDRKKMKAKIRSVSQEAKSSAIIIGSLPFCIVGALMVISPNYLDPMFETRAGHIMLIGSGLWMLTGCLMMRKMINFEI